jgi:hypothetical protein
MLQVHDPLHSPRLFDALLAGRPMSDAPPIIQADPQVRRRVLAGLVLSTLIGVVAVVAADAYVNQLVALLSITPHRAVIQIQRFAIILATVILLLTSALSGVLGYFSLRVLCSGQYPPPGMKVLRDIPLQTGKSAACRALAALVLAIAVLGSGIGASLLLMRAAYDPRLHRPRPRWQAVATGLSVPRFCALPVGSSVLRHMGTSPRVPQRGSARSASALLGGAVYCGGIVKCCFLIYRHKTVPQDDKKSCTLSFPILSDHLM